MFNKKKAKSAVKFYSEPVIEELYTGYLIKSPTRTALPKNTKSWKRRFFVLSKTSEDSYQLTYHANHESIDKPLRVIDISKISLLFTSPETHQKWDWIKKKLKCSPSSVLFLRVEDNTLKHSDYFLIGENSVDVEGWISALFKAMRTQKLQNKLRHTDNTLQDDRFRSASEILRPNFSSKDNDRWTVPELMSTYPSHEMHTHAEKEICGCQNDLKNSLILTQEEGKTCVCQKIQDSSLFHKSLEPKDENQPDDSWSAPKLMLTYPSMHSHYDYPRRLSESPVALKIPFIEDEDEIEEMEDESPEESEFMSMELLQRALENDQQEADTICTQKNETHTHVEKEICVSQNDLKNSLILTQAEGKRSVSDCWTIQDLCLFHKRDQILAC